MKTFTIKYMLCVVAALSFGRAALAQAQFTDTPQQAPEPKVKQESFSEYLKEEKQESANGQETVSEQQNSDDNSSWIGNLVNKVTETTFSSNPRSNQADATPLKRTNASVFDIAGVMLRMDKQQVSEALVKRGYQKTSEHMEIPNFIRWRYEEQCRNQGVVGFEKIENCVVMLSKQNNYQYVQQMSFSNFRSKENIDVFFTSNFTGNKVYRVMYETEAANITGNGAKAEYLRNLKVFDFWKKINQKYGSPDNKEQIIWGLGMNKPSLQASTGKLVLDDPMLLELDYTRMSREDQKFMNTAVYTF